MTQSPPSPALFLDRDGVINEEVGYLHKPGQVRWVPGIFDLCRSAKDLGYKLVVVTNQAGIGRGLYTQADFDTLTSWMMNQFADRDIPLAGVYCCPFHPEHGLGVYKREHEDRKPNPGMILRAARDLDLDLTRSILIGDRCSDIAAARAAGLSKAFLLAGTESAPCPHPHTPVSSLTAIAGRLSMPSCLNSSLNSSERPQREVDNGF
ncbi:D-glycero-beta-D-manno-heptose 1,7-bisphosphate 7-phosphatase [Granulicella sp. 5B5]|uniref:D-glycero-alpha-D-manno-heptose-1,7-bisphosphate 7-phosphatase n=1 Tax=Granulicella sp. 5B5 TaxID=1617967 RepID=UPI0015F5B6B6|nr:HAD family hydrolase [Granulicella sp. 5B5]QMV19191.1 D-glycero-beta-D-manno-heptose 1,7-bisphosphate 7-phosphatase [Granulicella sp. 5B5]